MARQTKKHLEEIKQVNRTIYDRVKDIQVTPDNYYSILGTINNSPSFIAIDIVSFSALLNWDEKLRHLNHYIGRLQSEGV